MRIVGIVAPFVPRGLVPGEIPFIETQWVNGHSRHVPGAASSGTPWESQTNFRDGNVWGLYKSPVGTGSAGKYRFIEKPGVQDEGSHHVAKRRFE